MEAVYNLLKSTFPDFDVYYGYQKINVDDLKNTIVISLVDSTDVCNNNIDFTDEDGLYKEKIINGISDTIQIDYLTRDLKNALNNLNLIRACFSSVLSLQIQSKFRVSFSTVNRFNNTSELEGTGYVIRYTTNLTVFRTNEVVNTIDNYDNFNVDII